MASVHIVANRFKTDYYGKPSSSKSKANHCKAIGNAGSLGSCSSTLVWRLGAALMEQSCGQFLIAQDLRSAAQVPRLEGSSDSGELSTNKVHKARSPISVHGLSR